MKIKYNGSSKVIKRLCEIVNDLDDRQGTQTDWDETDSTKLSFLLHKPSIPSKTSELTNDSTYVTKEEMDEAIAAGGGGGATIVLDDELSATSENGVKNKVITEAIDKKMDKVNLSKVATSGSYNDLEDKPFIPSVDDKADIEDVVFTGDVPQYRNPAMPSVSLVKAFPQAVFNAIISTLGYIESRLSRTEGSVYYNGEVLVDYEFGMGGYAKRTAVDEKITSVMGETQKLLKQLCDSIQWHLSLKVNKKELSTVAFSGSYDDLIDKPPSGGGTEFDPTGVAFEDSATSKVFLVGGVLSEPGIHNIKHRSATLNLNDAGAIGNSINDYFYVDLYKELKAAHDNGIEVVQFRYETGNFFVDLSGGAGINAKLQIIIATPYTLGTVPQWENDGDRMAWVWRMKVLWHDTVKTENDIILYEFNTADYAQYENQYFMIRQNKTGINDGSAYYMWGSYMVLPERFDGGYFTYTQVEGQTYDVSKSQSGAGIVYDEDSDYFGFYYNDTFYPLTKANIKEE